MRRGVNDKRVDPETVERRRFSSAIPPPRARKTPQVQEVLPLLYLHGLSSQDFGPALGQFLGSGKGLSAATITELTETWQAEQKAFAARDLSSVDYAYLWADGIHVNVRLGTQAVPFGADRRVCGWSQGADRAHRRLPDAAESWSDLLRDAKRRGMRAPVLRTPDIAQELVCGPGLPLVP